MFTKNLELNRMYTSMRRAYGFKCCVHFRCSLVYKKTNKPVGEHIINGFIFYLGRKI